MMKKILNIKCFMLALLMFISLLFTVTPAWSADKLAADLSYRFGKKEIPQNAIEKVGFFLGVENGRVRIQNQKTYRMYKYIAAPGMIVTFEEKAFDLFRIHPHSIVKLIIVNAEVVEIILVEGSS